MIHLFGRPLVPFSTRRAAGWPARDMYCPHPYTNWSLNPAFRAGGRKLHTAEGFRRTADVDSILDWVGDGDSVYVLGQSSAYCTNLLGLGQAWPDKLAERLPGIKVVNAAVGGHSTYQSLIRFLAWGPVIRPRLTIVYSCKNDLTPLKVARLDEPRVHPDHQNIVAQYGMAVARHLGWRAPTIGLAFPDREEQAGEGLARFGDALFQGVLARYDAMADCAAHWGGRVLLVTEVIRGSAYQPPMDRLNDALPIVAARHAGAESFDVRPLLPRDDAHFEDKLHLTERGCTALADLIAGFVGDRRLLAPVSPVEGS